MAKITIAQARKPTYEQLERRIHDLEATIQRREEFVRSVMQNAWQQIPEQMVI